MIKMKRKRDSSHPSFTPKAEVFIVPWFSKSEWLEVREKLFSGDMQEMQWAVERLAIWKCRQPKNIPKPVEVTEMLIRARVKDLKFHRHGLVPYKSDAGLAINYVSGIVRFMAMVGSLQHDREEGSSFTETLRSLEIPEWMAKLRNDAAHYQLPSTPLLRTGCQVALDWLQAHYWDSQEEIMHDLIVQPKEMILDVPVQNELRPLLVKYQQLRYEGMKLTGARRGSGKEMRLNELRLSKTVASLQKICHREMMGFVDAIVHPGFLVPKFDHLEALLSPTEREFLNSETIRLPSSLLQFWRPILDFFKSISTLQVLMETLIIENAQRDPLSQRMATAWVLQLVKETSGSPHFDWFGLMETTLKRPNVYTPPLLTDILMQQELDFDDTLKQTLLGLVQILLGTFNSEDSSKIKKKAEELQIFTVEDLKEEFNECVDTEASGPWRLASSQVHWDKLPAGILPSEALNTMLETNELDDSDNESALPWPANQFEEDNLEDAEGEELLHNHVEESVQHSSHFNGENYLVLF